MVSKKVLILPRVIFNLAKKYFMTIAFLPTRCHKNKNPQPKPGILKQLVLEKLGVLGLELFVIHPRFVVLALN